MAALRPEIRETLLKRGSGTVTWIAPHLTSGFFGLLVRRRQQCTVMFFGQRLPVQIVRARQSRLARTLAATMLMHDDATQGLDILRNPDRVIHAEDQRARVRGGLVAHAIVGRIGRGKYVIRRLLSAKARQAGDKKQR